MGCYRLTGGAIRVDKLTKIEITVRVAIIYVFGIGSSCIIGHFYYKVLSLRQFLHTNKIFYVYIYLKD